VDVCTCLHDTREALVLNLHMFSLVGITRFYMLLIISLGFYYRLASLINIYIDGLLWKEK
jgi:hypothetical protein